MSAGAKVSVGVSRYFDHFFPCHVIELGERHVTAAEIVDGMGMFHRRPRENGDA